MTRSCRLLLVVLVAALPFVDARADGYLDEWHPHTSFWSLGWEVGIPVQSLRASWVDQPSPAGGQLEVRVGVVPHVSVGLATNYNWFDQGSADDTAGYRRFSAFALRGTVHWYVTSSALQPFVGIGVGPAWTVTSYQGPLAGKTWGACYLAVDPEVGLLLSTSDAFAFYLLGRYQWTGASFGEVRNAQWVGVQLGMGWFF